MDFVKKGTIMTKYLSDGCEFKKSNESFTLISTNNDKYNPFIGETHSEEIWDMISSSDITHGEKHDKMYLLLLNHFKSGQTVFNKESNILLKKGERIIYTSGNSIRLNEPKSVRVTNSAHYGTSHRHGNRSHSFGVSKSTGESHDVIKNVDIGQIIITNKRFIFSGAKRNVDVNISQITGITPYNNGIKLQRKNKQKAEYFIGIDNQVFTYSMGNEMYFFTFNGDIIKAMIEGGLNKTPQRSKLMESKSQLESKPQSNKQDDSKTNVTITTDYSKLKLKVPSDWVQQKNDKNAFTIKRVIDSTECEINVHCELRPSDIESHQDKVTEVIKNGFGNVTCEHKTISGIDMFLCTSYKEVNDKTLEIIFAFFYDENLLYRLFLNHKLNSKAKTEYFDILNSIKLLDINGDSNQKDSSNIFCPNCGINIDSDSKFCMECGFKLK